jgi:hypothetical protein
MDHDGEVGPGARQAVLRLGAPRAGP